MEQRYQELGYAADYLRDTTGSALRDLVKGAGGSQRDQDLAQFVGSTVGTVVGTVAASRNKAAAAVVTSKAIAGDIVHELRSRRIQGDRNAVQKFFKRKLTNQSPQLEYLQKAYWYGQQERFNPAVGG